MSRHVSLQGLRNHTDRALRDWTVAVADGWDKPYAVCSFAAAAESANARRITVTVTHRKNQRLAASFLVRFIVGTASTGVPGGTQSISVVTGTLIQTVTSGQVIDILTNDEGLAHIDVTVSGAATRYVSAAVIGEIQTSNALTWA